MLNNRNENNVFDKLINQIIKKLNLIAIIIKNDWLNCWSGNKKNKTDKILVRSRNIRNQQR